MSWFLVDDDFHCHPKVVGCSLRALGLWVKAGSWSKRYLTDGFIPKDIARQLKGEVNCSITAVAQELCERGLWVPSSGGWQFHQWTEIQGSRAEAHARRAQDAARKATYRANLAHKSQRAVRPDDKRSPSAVRPVGARSPAEVRAESERSPSVLSSPLLSSPTERERDLNLRPPLPTLTGSTHAHARNTNGGGGEDEVSSIELDKSREAQAFAWLNGVLMETTTQPAKRRGGKWTAAYRYIGAQPLDEWLLVEACLRSELTSRRLAPRECTPGHVADYWADYAASAPPGSRNGHTRGGPSAVGTRAEHDADAALEEPLP